MAQKRIEWACPECGKRFAIPANANMPERCPTCQQSATEQTTAKAKASPPPLPITPPVVTATETPLPNIGEITVESEVPSISVPAPKKSRTSNRTLPRKYPNLRTLSLACRVLGVAIWVLTLYLNVRVSFFFVQSEIRDFFKSSSSFIMTVIEVNTAILLIGGFWGVVAFGAAELITLFINVEENTRLKRS